MPGGEPPVDRFQLRLLPLADLFMAVMLSRPHGLTLRRTWVTPATLTLALGVLLLGLTAGMMSLIQGVRTTSLPLVAIGLLVMVLSLWAGTVALYGFRQRLLAIGGRSQREEIGKRHRPN